MVEFKMKMSVLVWLEWPEACFRAGEEDMRFLRSLVSSGTEVVRAGSERAFLRELPRATHAITWHFKGEWFGRAKRLKALATPAAGRELVDWKAAPQGVRVHFGAFHGEIISETVVAFILAWAHGFFRPELKPVPWPRDKIGRHCRNVCGTRAVIVGYGKIGRAIGAKLASFGVEVEGFGRKNIAKLPAAAAKADWLVLALPGDTGTDDLLDAKLLARLPRRCVVVNVGRGNAVDERALLAALREGRIAGAYLDVFKGEPTQLAALAPDAEAPLASAPAAGLPWNLVRMPHSSAFSPDYLKRCFLELKNDGII